MANLWLLGSDDPQPDDPTPETQAAEHQTAPKSLPSDDSDLKASIAQRIETASQAGTRQVFQTQNVRLANEPSRDKSRVT